MIIHNTTTGEITSIGPKRDVDTVLANRGISRDDVNIYTEAEWKASQSGIDFKSEQEAADTTETIRKAMLDEVSGISAELADDKILRLLYMIAPAINFVNLPPKVKRAVKAYARHNGLPLKGAAD